MAGSSTDTIPTLSDSTYGIGHMEVEEDVAVIEESLIFIKDEVDIGIKQEEIPEDVHFPGIKSEPDEVSYVFVWLFFKDMFYHYSEMSVFFFLVKSVFIVSCNNISVGMKIVGCDLVFVSVGGSVCTRSVGLQFIVENI
jgi:hypothetical protein